MTRNKAPRTAVKGVENVLIAAQKRIAYLFDNYDNIQLSYSGGKDSSVLFHLIYAEAQKRGRKFFVYFQDQEAEYQATIEMVEWVMSRPLVIPLWYQVPIFMTNATSQEALFMFAWGEGEQWIRDKHPLAIHKIETQYPQRFYPFNFFVAKQLAKRKGKSVSIIGLRAEEAPERRLAMFGEDSRMFWLRRINKPHTAYPIIDWSFKDVWKFLIENNYKYNRVYDKLYALGRNLRNIRVSNLIHEKAYKSLADLQEIEPATYDKLEKRLKGVHCGAMYARENLVYSTKELPSKFKNWREYKDFLLASMRPELVNKFQWSKRVENEDYYKYMVRRLLLCDWEGALTYQANRASKDAGACKRDAIIEKWLKM